jgi:hypothetical protein
MSKKRTQKRRSRHNKKKYNIIERKNDYVYPTSMDYTTMPHPWKFEKTNDHRKKRRGTEKHKYY